MDRGQRRAERSRARLPVRVRPLGAATPIEGFTRDVSRMGMFIETEDPLPPGSRIEIELFYEDQAVAVPAVVVRTSEDDEHSGHPAPGGMGVATLRPLDLAAAGIHDDEVEATASEGPEGETPEALTPREDRIDPGTEVSVFFGSQRRRLTLRSLSVSGAAVVSPKALPEIPFVRLNFRLPGSPAVVVDGVPVRSEEVDEGTLLALQFLDPSPEAVQRIADFVAAHRRRERNGE